MSWLERLAEIRDRDWVEAEPSERAAKADEVIQVCSYAAAAAAVVPVPMAELALLVPVHSAMVMTVGHVYGRPVSRTEAARVAVELGAIAGVTMAGTAALSVLRKVLLPGIGGLLAAPASFALTWALGRVAIEYFQNPDLSRERLKVVFDEAMAEGRKLFSREQLDGFRRRYGEGRDVAQAADAEPANEAQTPAPEVVDVEPEPPEEAADAEPQAPTSGRPKRNL